jgi:hypothetical protein
MTPSRTRLVVFVTLLAMAAVQGRAQQVQGDRVRYEMTRSVVLFEKDAFSPEAMTRFAGLVDRGVRDIDRLVNHVEADGTAERRITFLVRDDIAMSRSYRRVVMLPGDRVRRDAAPYLHETTHILVPMKEDCLWLSEGFASYVQSHVAEKIGGYDGVVFSWGGNRNIDRLARRTLESSAGQAVLPYIGGKGEPPNLFENREQVAQPLYVLAHSFVKFMVEAVGLDKVTALAQSYNIEGSAEKLTGRTITLWKADWLAALQKRRSTGSTAPD